jgi:hypothetical protein|tara:strand:- start:344 stop:544 length:201 start_codon:yes stop_codon:yes gene_type:complete
MSTKELAIYHVYLRGDVLFKCLEEEDFKVIWDKIHHEFFKEELSYERVCLDAYGNEIPCLIGENSF